MWRELMRAAPSPLLAVDPDGVVRLASIAAVGLLERAEDEIVGRPLDAVLPAGMDRRVSTVDDWTVVVPERPPDREGMLMDLIRSQEKERARIAAGVHDDSLQVITAAMLRLQQLRHRLSDPDALQMLDRLEDSIALAADRLRRLIFDYRPRSLERSGLAAALKDTLSRMHDELGIEAVLKDELSEQPPVPTRLLLFRIAQEALANVSRHAQATRVEVVLSDRDRGYLLRVGDNGVGMPKRRPARSSQPGHLGVTLMRERAEFAGGWFRLDSAPGAGTTVTVWVPAGAGIDTPRGGTA